MAELKITPGPWKTRIHIDGDDCFVSANDVNGFPYDAEILGDDEYRDGFERKLADCNLVSEAPELYEALVKVWDDLGAKGNSQTLDTARRLASAALWKARGEEK